MEYFPQNGSHLHACMLDWGHSPTHQHVFYNSTRHPHYLVCHPREVSSEAPCFNDTGYRNDDPGANQSCLPKDNETRETEPSEIENWGKGAPKVVNFHPPVPISIQRAMFINYIPREWWKWRRLDPETGSSSCVHSFERDATLEGSLEWWFHNAIFTSYFRSFGWGFFEADENAFAANDQLTKQRKGECRLPAGRPYYLTTMTTTRHGGFIRSMKQS